MFNEQLVVSRECIFTVLSLANVYPQKKLLLSFPDAKLLSSVLPGVSWLINIWRKDSAWLTGNLFWALVDLRAGHRAF